MDLNGVVKRQLFLCYEMMENLIENTPDFLWNEKKGGYIYWQQIFHALCGSLYWLRTEEDVFTEPYKDLKVYPELEKDPENTLSRNQIRALLNEAKELGTAFFERYNSDQLMMDSVLIHEITGLDVVMGQIRHLQYHIGLCDGILRDAAVDVPEWLDVV